MGYNTEYYGKLKFTEELKATELAYLKTFLGKGIREQKEWKPLPLYEELNEKAYSINLEITETFDGLEWNGMEKTYGMEEAIKFIVANMRTIKPDFGLKGKFECQGEDFDDKYIIFVNEEDVFTKEAEYEINIEDGRAICPECNCKFKVRY